MGGVSTWSGGRPGVEGARRSPLCVALSSVLQIAYETLSDVGLRLNYDEKCGPDRFSPAPRPSLALPARALLQLAPSVCPLPGRRRLLLAQLKHRTLPNASVTQYIL